MSVNPDMSATTGVADEYVDLEHQVIRQKLDVDAESNNFSGQVLPGNPGAEFDPGERSLDREEIAQLVYYRRFASINFLDYAGGTNSANFASFGIVDASVGINGDLFRPVTTKETLSLGNETFEVDSGGEIGLLDHYTVYASPGKADSTNGYGGGPVGQFAEHEIDFYSWPTGGPIVDSFDTITCGFAAGVETKADVECQIELRYDFFWDVAEQGRSTNPFGRPSTR